MATTVKGVRANQTKKAKAAKAKAQPQPTTVRSGAAKGATDNQPHTKRALAEARKAEQAAFDAEKDAKVKAGFAWFYVPSRGTYGWYKERPKVRAEKPPIGAIKMYPKWVAPKTEKPAKSKGERKASAPRVATNRAYVKGATKDTSREGTWRNYMLGVIMSHKDTDSAKAAHAKSGQFASNTLDFNWSAKQGYIVFKD